MIFIGGEMVMMIYNMGEMSVPIHLLVNLINSTFLVINDNLRLHITAVSLAEGYSN